MHVSRGRRVWVPLVTLWLVWGSTYLGTALTVQSMPPLLAAGSRYFAAGLVVAAALTVRGGLSGMRVTRSQAISTVIMGLGIIGIWGAVSSLSLRYLPSGIAAIIGASIPLWVVVVRMAAGDRPAAFTVAGVGIGLVGLGIVVLPGGISPVRGADATTVALWSLALLGATLAWAFFSWRAQSMDVPPSSLVSTAWQLVFAGAAIMAAGLAAGERVDMAAYTHASWTGWSWLVLASVVGYAAYTYLVATAPLSLVSTYPLVNPMVAVLLGAVILGEPLTRSVVVGLVVVVGSVVLVTRGESVARREEPAGTPR